MLPGSMVQFHDLLLGSGFRGLGFRAEYFKGTLKDTNKGTL